MSKTKNNAVSIVRVTGMLMIIACHLSSWAGITSLAQILNVGVELFLIISGFLYAKKDISSPKQFIMSRWIKICLPLYLLIIVLLPANLYTNADTSLLSLLFYALNLQGLRSVLVNVPNPVLNGAGHLWFLTIIMICYLLLIPVKRLESNSFWNNRKSVILSFIVLIILDIALIFAGVQIGYFICYFLGYVIGKTEVKINPLRLGLMTVAMVIAMGVRFIGKHYLDNTVFYNHGIANLTHIVLALWIYSIIQFFSVKHDAIAARITSGKAWKYLEEYSFYIYIVHYPFLVGPFYIDRVSTNRVLQIALFLVFSVLSAFILKFITDLITNHLPASTTRKHIQ